MKVRFSTEARRYLSREAAYLKERSPLGAARFQRIISRARHQIETFPDSGLTDAIVSLAGARRVVVEEYLFDYDIVDRVATIMVIRHSRNTQVLAIDADLDDTDTPSSASACGKK